MVTSTHWNWKMVPLVPHFIFPGSKYALDFAICLNIKQDTCNLSNGWDTKNTDGQAVYSPVTGHVFYIDNSSQGNDSVCSTVGIQINTSDQSFFVVQLAHIEQLKHYNGTTNPPLQVGDLVKQDEQIAIVSSQTGGGCSGQSDHIHMELYSGSESARQAQPFIDTWNIGGCSFDIGGNHQDELVPCSGNVLGASTSISTTSTIQHPISQLMVVPTSFHPVFDSLGNFQDNHCKPLDAEVACTLSLSESSNSTEGITYSVDSTDLCHLSAIYYPCTGYAAGSGSLTPGQSINVDLGYFDCSKNGSYVITWYGQQSLQHHSVTVPVTCR